MLPALPRLPFGNATAVENDDLDTFTATQRAVMPSIRRYEPLQGRGPFRHRSASISLGDVRLAATASTPVSMVADDGSETSLLVPLHGSNTSTVDGREHRWQAGSAAMFLPRTGRSGTSGMRSVLSISFDPLRLQATARIMLGTRGEERLDLRLQTPRLVPLGGTRSPALAALRQVLPLIELGGCAAENLRLLGVDDMLYRLVAVMLAPDALAPAFQAARSGPTAAAIGRVTEYIVWNLERTITLSDLERVSRLSARTLQIAFRKAHNCSPRDWIRRRRLVTARDRLERATAGDTVATVALACGFTRLATFSAAYLRRFGESPSATLARGRNKGHSPSA